MYAQPVTYGQPMGMQPIVQQPVMLSNMITRQVQFVSDPMVILDRAMIANVEQKYEFVELLTGCEIPNEYYVYTTDAQTGVKQYLFKAREVSDFCSRHFIQAPSRPFDLHYLAITYQGPLPVESEFARATRDCACTCCCACRAKCILTKNVSTNNNAAPAGGYVVGSVVDEFGCDPRLNMYDPNGVPTYLLTGDCCQCGFNACSRNSCIGRLENSYYSIHKGCSNSDPKVGTMVKYSYGFEAIVGDADNYQLNFPQGITADDKLLMITATILMDYMYFEDKNDHRHGPSRARGYY